MPSVAAQVLQAQSNLRPGGFQGKLFRPLQDHNGRFRKNIFQSQRLKIVETLDAVQVAVETPYVHRRIRESA